MRKNGKWIFDIKAGNRMIVHIEEGTSYDYSNGKDYIIFPIKLLDMNGETPGREAGQVV